MNISTSEASKIIQGNPTAKMIFSKIIKRMNKSSSDNYLIKRRLEYLVNNNLTGASLFLKYDKYKTINDFLNWLDGEIDGNF